MTPLSGAAVDICVPVYNGAAFAHQTLESILVQEFTDFRLLVSVDRSDDDSARLCRRYLADQRVRVFEHAERLGYVGNCNFLMRQVDAPFMIFAPHDDLLPPGFIGCLYEFFSDEPRCSVAMPRIIGFGEHPQDLIPHEVRGPVLRRLLDIIINQRSVAAFHGLVRVNQRHECRPMLPAGYLRDFEADVAWMAMAALTGELRRVDAAVKHKRYRPGMASRVWLPRSVGESRLLLVQHAARLVELAFPICNDDPDRRQVLMAAIVRLRGQGLNYGVPRLARHRPWFDCRIRRAFFRELSGPAAAFAATVDQRRLLADLDAQHGVVGASRLARQLETCLDQGRSAEAESLYQSALEMDPQAGWAEPFRQRLDDLARAPKRS